MYHRTIPVMKTKLKNKYFRKKYTPQFFYNK